MPTLSDLVHLATWVLIVGAIAAALYLVWRLVDRLWDRGIRQPLTEHRPRVVDLDARRRLLDAAVRLRQDAIDRWTHMRIGNPRV